MMGNPSTGGCRLSKVICSGTSVTWLGTSIPCIQTSLSTVKVTEQSSMEVFKQCGSCIIALLHQCFDPQSCNTSTTRPGSLLAFAILAMWSGSSQDPGQEMFIRIEKLSCCNKIPDCAGPAANSAADRAKYLIR